MSETRVKFFTHLAPPWIYSLFPVYLIGQIFWPKRLKYS
jgi:hypothetical protein